MHDLAPVTAMKLLDAHVHTTSSLMREPISLLMRAFTTPTTATAACSFRVSLRFFFALTFSASSSLSQTICSSFSNAAVCARSVACFLGVFFLFSLRDQFYAE